ncbi:hypothetical protein LTR53_008279 [Teratosphaeriaceae sp. CCFEE 6253]|nr:hypothetical protein LTR53_008279 [Teratosphaeriaceae sp. CCFEE 6253]
MIDSPDPITLPSSPLATRSIRASSSRTLAKRAHATVSPSKSFVLETGDQAGTSPWRIKVTVEAEPNESRGMLIGSPAKRRPKRQIVHVPVESEAEVSRPRVQRKRRSTPVRGGGARRAAKRDEQPTDDAGLMPPPSSSATKARRRRSLMEMPVERRSKRLSQAREELDLALQDAVGSTPPTTSDDEDEEMEEQSGGGAVLGDMTMMGEEAEDFTMVSVETLQSMRADTSLISRRGEGDSSGLSVNYLPSSPPKRDVEARERVQEKSVLYPDLSSEARRASHATYDAMSWKPTTLPKKPSPSRIRHEEQAQLDSEPSEWRREREAVSRRIEEAGTSQVIVIDDTTIPDADEHSEAGSAAGVDAPDDIWQEEASRSFEDDMETKAALHQHRHTRRTHTTAPSAAGASAAPALNNLFAGQVMRPPRAKIPRTWRRASGADFMYSDSPVHVAPLPEEEEEVVEVRKRDHSAGGESRASSGVLTPPSSEDGYGGENRGGDGEVEVEFTRVDGEGTQWHDDSMGREEEGDSSMEDDGVSGATSAGAEETGLFWQRSHTTAHNPPQTALPRPGRRQEKRAMDLSELLNLRKTSSPAKGTPIAITTTMKLDRSQQASSSRDKLSGGPADGAAVTTTARYSTTKQTTLQQTGANSRLMDDSWASKASHQRQLLTEMASAHRSFRPQHQSATEADHDTTALFAEHTEATDQYDVNTYVSEDDEDVTAEPSRSYEEHLNVESPQKIKVKFGDGFSGNSSLLAPKRAYAPLFASGRSSTAQTKQQPAQTQRSVATTSKHSKTVHEQQATTGLLSRLSSTLWSAVIRPTGPPSITPLAPPSPYPPALRAHIRSRYGVLSSSHPWTLAHMRTLHRMLNSCTSGRCDTIIPEPDTASPHIPPHLAALVGAYQLLATGDGQYHFCAQDALIVHTFMQVLVPARVVQAMDAGEVEFLGDEAAVEHRGVYGGQHGSVLVWPDAGGWGKRGNGGREIEWRFVVGALGTCVLANIMRDERIAKEGE